MSTAPHRLTTLRRAKQPALPISIVLIPGIGTKPTNQWNIGWLPERATVFAFEHDLSADGKSVNRVRIESESGRLLKALQALQSTKDKRGRSLLLVTHSLGSLILAQALSAAQTQVQLDRLSLIGVVFFSCVQVSPLVPATDTSTKAQLEEITATRNAEISRIVAISEAYAKVPLTLRGVKLLHAWLAKTSAQFRHLIKNTPVASVYETVETRVSRRVDVIISPPAAEITTAIQTSLAIDIDHNQTCNVDPDDPLCDELREWLQKIVPRSFEKTGSLGAFDGPKRAPAMPPTGFIPVQSIDLVPPATHQVSANLSTLPDAAPGPILPILFIPFSQNRNFHGRRNELRKMAHCLCSSDHEDESTVSAPKSFVLEGIGGIGKSITASEFVYQNLVTFDAVLWIAAELQDKLDESFADIATKLGLVNGYSAKARDKLFTRRVVLDWLKNPVRSFGVQGGSLARWLLVFDNVVDPSMLTDIWPSTGQGSILVTTRDRTVVSDFTVTDYITLEPFQTEDSKALLQKHIRQRTMKADQGRVEEVVKVLAGHPLAITQMAGVIEERNLGFGEFLEHYDDEHKRSQYVKAGLRGPYAADYEHNLATVWSFDKLSPDAKLLIDILSFFDPDGIPEFILGTLDKIRTDHSALLAKDYDYEEARSQLIRMSLIQRDQKQNDLIVHRMVQDSARAVMSDQHYCGTLMTALQLMDAAWPRDDEPAINPLLWKKCSLLYKHSVLLGRLANSKRFTPPKVANEERLRAVDVLLEAVWYGTMRSHFEDTIKLLELAAEMLVHFKQNQSHLEPSVKARLLDIEAMYEHKSGVLALHINDKRASLYHLHRHVTMLENIVKPEELRLQIRWGFALNELGNAYLQNGEAVNAEELYLRSVEIFDNLDDTSTNMLTMPLTNLGYALWLQNRLTEARDTLESARNMRELSYGRDDTISFALGKLYLGLGNVLMMLNDLDGSMKWHELCVQQFTETLGPSHHRTADASVKLADHYFRIGEYRQAQERLVDAHMVFGDKDIFKPERARVAYMRWKLADAMGEEDADNHADAALKLYKLLHGTAPTSIADLGDPDFDESIIFWSR